jgi:hypothetical protein
MSAASSSASLQIIDEDDDDNANADANLTGPSIITQCLSPSSPNHTNTNNEISSSEKTPIPADLEQLTIPFYGLADSAPFIGQLQSILESLREEQKLDKTLSIEVLFSIAYQLLTAVGLSSSPDRQPTLPEDDNFPGMIVQPLMSHQGFGGVAVAVAILMTLGMRVSTAMKMTMKTTMKALQRTTKKSRRRISGSSRRRNNGRSGSAPIVLLSFHSKFLLELFIV